MALNQPTFTLANPNTFTGTMPVKTFNKYGWIIYADQQNADFSASLVKTNIFPQTAGAGVAEYSRVTTSVYVDIPFGYVGHIIPIGRNENPAGNVARLSFPSIVIEPTTVVTSPERQLIIIPRVINWNAAIADGRGYACALLYLTPVVKLSTSYIAPPTIPIKQYAYDTNGTLGTPMTQDIADDDQTNNSINFGFSPDGTTSIGQRIILGTNDGLELSIPTNTSAVARSNLRFLLPTGYLGYVAGHSVDSYAGGGGRRIRFPGVAIEPTTPGGVDTFANPYATNKTTLTTGDGRIALPNKSNPGGMIGMFYTLPTERLPLKIVSAALTLQSIPTPKMITIYSSGGVLPTMSSGGLGYNLIQTEPTGPVNNSSMLTVLLNYDILIPSPYLGVILPTRINNAVGVQFDPVFLEPNTPYNDISIDVSNNSGGAITLTQGTTVVGILYILYNNNSGRLPYV